MIQTAFFDIDGTLLDHSGGKSVFPASTAASLHAMQRKGIKVFVATGRASIMLDTIREYFPFDGFVTFNGQLVLDRNGTVLHRMAHNPEDIRRLVPLIHKSTVPAFLLEETESFPLSDTPEVRMHYQWMNMPYPPFYDTARLDKHPVLQFNLYMPLREAVQFLAPLEHVEVTTSGGDILDVIPKGGGKEVGIAAAAAYYGFSQEKIMVFGDGPNDARMLRWAGIGVAMGNGDAEAKAAADYVTTHVGRDGVKNALLHFGVLTPEDFE